MELIPERLLNYFDQHFLTEERRRVTERCYGISTATMRLSEQEALEVLCIDWVPCYPAHFIDNYRMDTLHILLERLVSHLERFFAEDCSRKVLKKACIDGTQDWCLESLKNPILEPDIILMNMTHIAKCWEYYEGVVQEDCKEAWKSG